MISRAHICTCTVPYVLISGVFDFAVKYFKDEVSIVVNNCAILHEFDWKSSLDVNLVRKLSAYICIYVHVNVRFNRHSCKCKRQTMNGGRAQPSGSEMRPESDSVETEVEMVACMSPHLPLAVNKGFFCIYCNVDFYYFFFFNTGLFPVEWGPVYCATKHAQIAYMRSWAVSIFIAYRITYI